MKSAKIKLVFMRFCRDSGNERCLGLRGGGGSRKNYKQGGTVNLSFGG